MVSFKNGIMRVYKNDYIFCPICGTQTKDGKKYRIKCTLESVRIMSEVGEHMAMPLTVDLREGEILLPQDKEATAYQGSAIAMLFLCEEGHHFVRTIAMNKDGDAFQFDEVVAGDEVDEDLVDALEEEDENEDED